MTYRFTPSEEPYELKIETDLIPKAIAAAQKVKPAEVIRELWESAIYRDIENHDPRFCWRRFISFVTP